MFGKMTMLQAALDFTGVSPWNPLASPAPEDGAYESTILDVDPAYNGGKSSKFTCDLKRTGQTTDIFIGNEPGEKGGNLKKWLQALACVAPDPQKFIDAARAGQIKFDPALQAVATFKGKSIHILVISVPGTTKDPQTGVERPNLPNKEFMSKAEFDSYVSGHGAGGKPTAPNGAPQGATTPAGTPVTPAAPAGGDVLKGLFG